MSEASFLSQAGWADAARTPLAGDASARKYSRLTKTDETAILMDEGTGATAALRRFSDLSNHLLSIGLSAPQILAGGSDQFLLIEDLGDAVFAAVMAQDPSQEVPLYKTAVDALIAMQSGPIPDGLKHYGPTEMVEADMLVFDWYPTPKTNYSEAKIDDIKTVLSGLLTTHLSGKPVLIHRDFHAENLIWLPDRTGPSCAGILDFQDAVSGSHAYDLASLLIDARRDVSEDTRRDIIDYFAAKTDTPVETLRRDIALCSAQRNLRILGIFARLAMQEGKRSYIDLIPRVWRNLMDDLRHPDLQELATVLIQILPPPTSAVLDDIRAAHDR